MQCEGNICAGANVRYELNTGRLLAHAPAALHGEAFTVWRSVTLRCINFIVLRQKDLHRVALFFFTA